jgi:hypothetical protein
MQREPYVSFGWRSGARIIQNPCPTAYPLGGGNYILVVEVFPIGSQVQVANYSPFRGFIGTILTFHMIAVPLDEPFCFYLVALEETHTQEPVWFEYYEVELVAPPLVDSCIEERSWKWNQERNT